MQQMIRWGILGTGNIARQFAAGMKTAQRGHIAAVGSRTENSARQFADAFDIRAAHGNYDALLADATVDAVYLSLPNSLHHEWTLKALEAGKHVLCEKPLAMNLRQASEMFNAARARRLTLAEAFMYRSHPLTHAVAASIAGGEIGDLKLIRASFCYRTRQIEGNIRFRADLGGGALMDVGCYCINLARTLAGAEPIDLRATGVLDGGGVDVLSAGAMRFESGIVASFTCAMNAQADNTAYLCGTEGYIEIPVPWKPPAAGAQYIIAHGQPPKMDQTAGALAMPPPRQMRVVDAGADLYALEADDFAASVLDGVAPRVSAADSLGNQRVLDAMREQVGVKFIP
jgi:predicted dehydrogenase